MAGKLFIKTHGCQMNEYDSDKMADVLAAENGLELTDNEAEADVILVNTCSIRVGGAVRSTGGWQCRHQRARHLREAVAPSPPLECEASAPFSAASQHP